MRYTCSDTPGVFKVRATDDSETVGYFQVIPGKGIECRPALEAIGQAGEPAQRRIEAASDWLQDFEEFWAESEESEHTDVGRANELLKAAAVVLENELKGWPG